MSKDRSAAILRRPSGAEEREAVPPAPIRRRGEGDRRGGGSASPTNGARFLGPALALVVLLPACGRSPGSSGPPSRPDGAAAIGDRPGVNLVQVRQGQRLPFQLRLDAEDGSGGTWLLRLVLGCREGGTALVRFALTDGISVADGETERTVSLAAGEERDEVLLIQVPPEGHHVAAVAVTLDGRKAEVYAEFGPEPSADAKGLKVRARNSGVRILRLGGGDK